MQENDIVTCSIHDIGINGEGIGQIEGMKVFVEGAIPGEKVVVKIKEIKKNYAVADIVRISHPSKERIDPPCPFYVSCGGCQIMHLSYPMQLNIKTKRVQDALVRIGKIKDIDILPCIPSDTPFGYRNKIQFPVGPDRSLGLYKKHSHEIVPIDECLLHLPLGEDIFEFIQEKIKTIDIEPFDEKSGKGEFRHVIIRSTRNTEEALVGFVTTRHPSPVLVKFASELSHTFPSIKGVVHVLNNDPTNRIMSSQTNVLFGKNEIREKIGEFDFYYSLESFFQVNPVQAERLYTAALEHAKICDKDMVLDAFCGVGTLSIFFAKKAKHVWGVECVTQAIQNAKRNAKKNNIENVQFLCGDVDHYIDRFLNVNWVIVNPPRKGCSDKFLKGILKIAPKGVVYISCDPATLARDLTCFKQNGYNIQIVQPFDMFPQTMHVETLVILNRS